MYSWRLLLSYNRVIIINKQLTVNYYQSRCCHYYYALIFIENFSSHFIWEYYVRTKRYTRKRKMINVSVTLLLERNPNIKWVFLHAHGFKFRFHSVEYFSISLNCAGNKRVGWLRYHECRIPNGMDFRRYFPEKRVNWNIATKTFPSYFLLKLIQWQTTFVTVYSYNVYYHYHM